MDDGKWEAQHNHIEAHTHSSKCYTERVVIETERICGKRIVSRGNRVSDKNLALRYVSDQNYPLPPR